MSEHTSPTTHLGPVDATARTPGRSRLRTALAFGTGVAATVAAGVTFATSVAGASVGADESTFVPITPCRLLDTRASADVGERRTPLGAGETLVAQVTGSNGDCSIPADAVGVALNATAVGSTQRSYATFHPADSARPLSSNLNYEPGQPPTPNKVDVRLGAGGDVAIFNAFGSVDVIADVTGYYTSAGLRDLTDEVARMAASAPFVVQGVEPSTDGIGLDPASVLSVELTAPADGTVSASYSTTAITNAPAGADVICGLIADERAQPTGRSTDDGFSQKWERGADGDIANLAGGRAFEVSAGETIRVHVLCDRDGAGSGSVDDTSLIARFDPLPAAAG